MGFHAVKTRTGKEERAADEIAAAGGIAVDAVLAPQGMNGYIIVEAVDREVVERGINKSTHAMELLPGETSFAEVKGFLSPGSDVEGFATGDTVFITGGPYEGEEARIQRVDEKAEQVTVELIDSAVPVPVAVSGDQVRLIEE